MINLFPRDLYSDSPLRQHNLEQALVEIYFFFYCMCFIEVADDDKDYENCEEDKPYRNLQQTFSTDDNKVSILQSFLVSTCQL